MSNRLATLMQKIILLTVLSFVCSVFLPAPEAGALGSTVVSLTNQERSSQGLSDYSVNSNLTSSAQVKAQDICVRSYWDHVAPDGTQPWDLMKQAGYSYSKAGENLAKGFETDAGVVNGWMNSPAHRANILHADYTEIGIGVAYCDNGETIIVAHYAKPRTAAPVKKAVVQQQPAEVKAEVAKKPATAEAKQQPAPLPAEQPVADAPTPTAEQTQPQSQPVALPAAETTSPENKTTVVDYLPQLFALVWLYGWSRFVYNA